ncbi:MAG: 30S ribosomal protein S12 methylthiotransferase RimO [Akkermansiaceae bacterium]|jgi:ribosomal protein S12 methylthiotransferase|nr:30S ribosomal protein S12 methylthiotransferase RimO [Akkermansiaceae bacterium]MBJ7283914.1 30S ribosomal protein S12 methylthiotransferase RimO [Akkermansiaceae bacterium]MBJ7395022.1 30S ribosomal protein S12 methylthiotransferase RimO [Akkermansiaceae bacterium]MBJ7423973.1 30S ribosomal protein S12 methylthiotransferase RimO [Akkermansiaceae bacterium]
MSTTVGLISLGCAKNLIDSEVMIGHLAQAGMSLTPDPELADVLIINTCSFIDMAKQESIDAIFGAVKDRAEDPDRVRQKIIVAGCLSQRFAKDLPGIMPEVDAFIGLDQITKVAPIIENLLGKKNAAEVEKTEGPSATNDPRDFVTLKPQYVPDYSTPRIRLTPDHFAYVKIAEGCNHTCTFCIIPTIRGKHRSRTQDSVVREVQALVASGVKEINLISQDTTYFGMDQWEGKRPTPSSPVDSSRGESLSTLLREINKIEGDFWVRLLYTHPAHWSDELIVTIAECDKVAKYVDIPLQHISDRMLTAMKRVTSGDYIRDLLRRMRAGIPGLGIRTTFIVGFPGETEEDFQELLEFIEEFRFERAGVFQYSKEEGTRANKLDGHLHHATRKSRWSRSMAALQKIAGETNQAQVGKQVRVLVEQPGIARTQWDAPEIDGSVMVDEKIPVGEFAEITIGDWRGYDLVAAR